MKYPRAAAHAWSMVNPFRPMIRDDRARKCPLFRLDRRRPWGQSDLPDEVFSRIRSDLLSVTRHGMGGSPRVLWPLIVGYGLFFAWMSRVSSAPPVTYVAWAVVIGCLVWAALTYRHRIPRAGRDLIAIGLLNEHRCASCANPLAGVAPEPDECTVCPECGAAWRIPKDGSRRVFL